MSWADEHGQLPKDVWRLYRANRRQFALIIGRRIVVAEREAKAQKDAEDKARRKPSR